MRIKFDSRKFAKDMNKMMDYSTGFLDGVQLGKKELMDSIGVQTVEVLKNYIDSSARLNPSILHHVYEWSRVGSPNGRLYDISYTVSNLGLSFGSSFRQSKTVQDGSTVPFYNKAKIMEDGVPVTIIPIRSQALRFTDNGEEIFTKRPVTVLNPGGQSQGQFQETFDNFFERYFTQAFLRSSGIAAYLENPVAYKKNLSKGKSFGRSAGVSTGFKWIANAGVNKIV